MTPKEITAILKEAAEAFPYIQVKLNDDNTTRICLTLLSILISIPYNEAAGKHNLVGIIQNAFKYLAKYSEVFPVLHASQTIAPTLQPAPPALHYAYL